ncbi:unnamed protein product [Brachionus calyciflorus]|uniref:Uncharacterized protein n=1 Tax=Brachionus calyciflorus TaxID=104777 RepID=A0A814MRB3_9BILA|nr:unnamed protein product [Brachionus calyciflorus]
MLFILLLQTNLVASSNLFFKEFDLEIPYTSNTSIHIATFQIHKQLECFSYCLKRDVCIFVSIYENNCILHTSSASNIIKSTPGRVIYKRIKTSLIGITAHWPIYLSNTKDIIKRQDLYNPVNAEFTTNRYGVAYSAIKITNGYYRLPNNLYKEGDFTFLAWVKINVVQAYARIFELSDESGTNCLSFIPYDYISRTFYAASGSESLEILNYPAIPSSTWTHVAIGIKYNQGFFYMNGIKTLEGRLNIVKMANNTKNIIGGSLTNNVDPFLSADLDDIKFYNKALSSEEILSEYSNS